MRLTRTYLLENPTSTRTSKGRSVMMAEFKASVRKSTILFMKASSKTTFTMDMVGTSIRTVTTTSAIGKMGSDRAGVD